MRTRHATSAIALAAALALAGCAGDADQEPTTPATSGASASATGPATTDPAGDDATPDGVNDADVTFATMMIPHHEQAIVMSDMVLPKEDLDPSVLELAQDIKDAQGPEIEQLRGWLEDWGVDQHSHDMSDMEDMDGMLSEDELAALDAAPGPEASRLYLEQMIVHHEGAVDMARTEVEQGSHTEAVELANSIIESQNAEIQQMRDMLAAL